MTSMIPTPHLEVKNKDEFAKTVLMPGDPLRAKYIADNFLEDVVQINSVRGMLGFTGYYKGKKISVLGSGMGIPSMGIYSYELYNFYDVETIVRLGSCGAYQEDLKLYDVILVEESYSESPYAKLAINENSNILKSNEEINKKLHFSADKQNIQLKKGAIHSTEVFYYAEEKSYQQVVEEYNCLGVEMESFALFANAKHAKKRAVCLLTVSDSLVTKEKTTSEEREKAFSNMISIALEADIY